MFNFLKKEDKKDILEEILDPKYVYFYPLKEGKVPSMYQMTGGRNSYNAEMFDFFKESLNFLALNRRKMILPLAIGRDAKQNIVIEDLVKQPHLLVAGMTNSGKSTFLHSLIFSLLTFCHPKYLDLTLVDPKGVSFQKYAKIARVAKSTEEIHKELDLSIVAMERTYSKLVKGGVETLAEYNKSGFGHLKKHEPRRFKVIIFDEFADFSMQDRDGMTKLIRLSQKGRAAGIHLILATQRPDATVVDGLIKANFSSRAIFKVINSTNSNVALDENGAELLSGKGELLWRGNIGKIQLRSPKICTQTMKKMAEFLAKKGRMYKYNR